MDSLTIIVADSSTPEHLSDNQVTCRQLSRHSAVHRVFPADILFVEKAANAVAEVNTPFMALCADDDFVLPAPISQAIELLRCHPDISCVQGLEIFFRPAVSVGFTDRLLLDIHGGNSIDAGAAAERLVAHLRRYRSSIYGIRRTAEFLADVRSIVPLQDQYMLMELAFSSLDAVRGRIIRLPEILTLRESHGDVAFRKHSDVTYWEKVIFSPTFSQWLAVYLNIVSTRLEEFSELRGEDARNTVRDSLRAFSVGHFKALGRSSDDDGSVFSRLKAAAFNVPLVGSLGKAAWLKAAKAYDRQRIQKLYGNALRNRDYLTLIRRLEQYFGYTPGNAIVR